MAAAYASPLIAPRSIELLCSTNGAMRLLSQTADGEETSDLLHCAMCAPAAAPPDAIAFVAPHPLAYATQRTPASILVALTRPPLPARGPPDFS